MKFMQRAGIYKSPNVTFNPATCQAFSYGWWCFVKRIRGKVIFNSYRYSVTTAKHQRRVRDLLAELGIDVYREVQVSGGLQGISSMLELNKANALQMSHEREIQEIKRLERNRKAKARREAAKIAHALSAQAQSLTLVAEVRGE